MIRTMKNSVVILFASMLLCIAGSLTAFAVGAQDEVILDRQGDNFNVSIEGINSDVSTFSLKLVVNTTADTFDAVDVGFNFSNEIDGSTKIHKATFNNTDSRCFVTIYVAGGSDLFATKPLPVGTLTLALDTQKSPGAQVTVDVPEGNALSTVTSGLGEEAAAVYLQSAPTIDLGDVSAIEPPNPIAQEGEEGGQGRITSVQPIDDDSTSNRNSTTGGDLARTGDTTPIIPIVLIAVACIAVLVAAFFLRKNAKKPEEDK